MSSQAFENMAGGRGDAQFALSRHTQDTRAFARIMVGFGAVAVLACIALLPAGVVDGRQAASGAITLLVICLGLPASFTILRRLGGGEVRVDREGVTLTARLNVAKYPWADIERVRATPTMPTGLYGLMIRATRSADKAGTVELDLRRPHRIGLSSGTNSVGLSTGLHKVRLHLDDPDRFMTIVNDYLAA